MAGDPKFSVKATVQVLNAIACFVLNCAFGFALNALGAPAWAVLGFCTMFLVGFMASRDRK